MTYLTQAQQRRHIALGQLSADHNVVNFWCNMQWPAWLEEIIPLAKLQSMVINSIAKGTGQHLRFIDVILIIDATDLADYAAKLRAYAEGDVEFACVEPKEILQGKNIIYLRILGLQSKSITCDKIDNRKLQSLMDETVDHELVHIWHARQSDIVKVYEKHVIRLNKAATGLMDYVEALDAQLQAIDDLQDPSKQIDMKELTAKVFVFLRKFVEEFKLFCLMEGLVRCMEAVVQEKDVSELVRQGHKDIDHVKKCFSELSEAYEGLLLIASKIVNGAVAPRLKKRIQDNMRELHRQYSYTIGSAMVGLLWVNFENPLKEIAVLNVAQFYRLYEKVCAEKNVAPLLKTSPGKGGILNLSEYSNNLNTIRKKYKNL